MGGWVWLTFARIKDGQSQSIVLKKQGILPKSILLAGIFGNTRSKLQTYPTLPCWTPRKIPRKFHGDISIKSVLRMIGPNGGTCRTLRVLDLRLGGPGHS